LAQTPARPEALSLLPPVAALVHVGLDEAGAHPLGGVGSIRRGCVARLPRRESQIGEEVPQVECWFRLTDRVEVDQAALVVGEYQLRWAEVPVAEARRPRLRRCGACDGRFEPLADPGGVR